MKMHGPDRDTRIVSLDNNGYTSDTRITLSEVYDIIHDRLEYVRLQYPVGFAKVPLENLVDIDAITQQCMVEIRKKLGLYVDNPPPRGQHDT